MPILKEILSIILLVVILVLLLGIRKDLKEYADQSAKQIVTTNVESVTLPENNEAETTGGANDHQRSQTDNTMESQNNDLTERHNQDSSNGGIGIVGVGGNGLSKVSSNTLDDIGAGGNGLSVADINTSDD